VRLTKYYWFVAERSIKHNGVIRIKRLVFGEVDTDYNLGATNRCMMFS
jgi:hypothetical protein